MTASRAVDPVGPASPAGLASPVGPARQPTDLATLVAADEVAAARAALAGELDTLKSSARAAVDVKAKVRRNPGKAAAAAGGAAFLAIGGPRRVLGGLKRRVLGAPEPLPASLLPEEVEKAVRALGSDGAKVRGALERGFTGWLKSTEKERKKEGRQRSLVNLAMKVAVPVATRAAKEAASRAFAETKDAMRPTNPPDPGGQSTGASASGTVGVSAVGAAPRPDGAREPTEP